MSLSSITISGTLKKLEKRLTPTNVPITNLLLEVTFIPRGSSLQKDLPNTQLIRINAWRDLGIECEKKLKIGDKVLVIGRLQVNAFTTSEGKKKRESEIDATSVISLNQVIAQNSLVSNENNYDFESQGQNKTTEEINTIDDLMNTEEIPF